MRYREIYEHKSATNMRSQVSQRSHQADIYLLIQAWKMRNIDPLIALNPILNENKYSCLEMKKWKEWELIEEAKKNPDAYALFKRYHSEQVVNKHEDLILVDADFIDSAAISFLQRKTIELLNEKGMAVESMPTSNVRISYYDDYSEHHIFRWLNISRNTDLPKPSRNTDLPKPVICLCSDDPGIFATNLRNEFAHIYQTLIESYGYSHEKAYTEIKQLNENSRVYRFND
ncbi:MAG: hypothetical protein GY795_27455 [Desulfobacterales bacterium]|nr:hypothetical protein [Desulfobacterales bacterium]